ncbi:unnamed protein product [Linum trigynum]|uniref:F-box domain-containing protein n=1 Tax=Linum trigynum TaxID=586398 RepID=A0AAV2ELU4_9ROSI
MPSERRRIFSDGAKFDRLSGLPDEVLHHVLSFLDTKCVVQSSILSNRWRSLWKTVPVFNFNGESFNEHNFKDHVDELLKVYFVNSHRLCHVSILNCPGFGERSDIFAAIFRSISLCDQSIETLDLKRVQFDNMTFGLQSSGFKVLTTLTLSECYLDFSSWNQPLNPFARFPMLKNLALISCSCSLGDDPEDDETMRCLKVVGLQLLILEVDDVFGFDEIKVFAPNLKRYTYKNQIRDFSPMTEVLVNVPSLEHADIKLLGYKGLYDEYKQEATRQYANLFLGMSRAVSLVFQFDTAKEVFDACGLLRDRLSPFKRLKSLSLRHSEQKVDIPNYVTRFFFGDSSLKYEKGVNVTKVTTSF